MKQLSIENWRRVDNSRSFPLEVVREDLSGLGLPSRRECWVVLAETEQGAHRTVEYHFGHSALWYRLETTTPPIPKN